MCGVSPGAGNKETEARESEEQGATRDLTTWNLLAQSRHAPSDNSQRYTEPQPTSHNQTVAGLVTHPAKDYRSGLGRLSDFEGLRGVFWPRDSGLGLPDRLDAG